MLTRDLKKSNDNMVVHGKLILSLSTNLSTPINQAAAGPSRPPVSATPSTNGLPQSTTPSQSSNSLHPDMFPGSRAGSQSQRSSTVNPASPGTTPATAATGSNGTGPRNQR